MAATGTNRVLFARIGWMNFYSGIVPGDPELIGGGAYNETQIGSEVLNFAPHVDRMYGFVQGVRSNPLALDRIDPQAEDVEAVGSTLVIFVSRRPHKKGQVIIGWYRNATVHRAAARDPRSAARNWRVFNIVARRKDAVLLPTNERWQPVPTGSGAFG